MKNPLRVTIIHKVNGKETTRAATEQEYKNMKGFPMFASIEKGFKLYTGYGDTVKEWLFESYNNITNTVYLREV